MMAGAEQSPLVGAKSDGEWPCAAKVCVGVSAATIVGLIVSIVLMIWAPWQPSVPKPNWHDYAEVARWLVRESDYGVASTLCSEVRDGCPVVGAPFGNIMSISDGDRSTSTGVIYTYLPDLDPSPADLKANPQMSITFTEKAVYGLFGSGRCVFTAENPPCARLTVAGKMTKVPDGPEKTTALDYLYSRHPYMRLWPSDHGFSPYWIAKNDTQSLFFLDMFGPAHEISVDDYYAATP